MLDLIPSLLAAQTVKQAIAEEVQSAKPESIAQEKAPVVIPVSAIAPPEVVLANPPIAQALPSVPIREITFSRASSLQASPTQSPQAANQVPVAAPPPLQQPNTIQNVVIVKSTQSRETAETLNPPTLESPLNDRAANAATNRSEPETITSSQSQATTQSVTGSTEATLDLKDQTIRQDFAQPPVGETAHQPELKNDRQTPSDRLVERQKVLKQRLAEIVAKGNAQKEAERREALITRSYEAAAQGKFQQARLLLNDSIPAPLRAEVVKTIDSLEANSRKVGVAQATKPIRTALKQRQLEQRQLEMLRSVPSLPPLPKTTIAGSDRRYTRITSPVVKSLPQASAKPDRDYSVTNPASSDLQAFSGALPIPGTPETLSKDRIVYPLPTPAPVTSKYGWRVHPIKGDRRFHAGVDLGAPQGTPVLATQTGKIKVADNMGGYGLAIVLEHDNGTKDALYAHLSQMFVRPGQVVKPGTIIGQVGSTGFSTGPHLHYETRKRTAAGWTTTDPGAQLEAAKVQLERVLASARSGAGHLGG